MLEHSSFSGLPNNRKQSNTSLAPGPLNSNRPDPRDADSILPIEWLVADLLIGYDAGTRRGSETSATWVLAGLRKAWGSLIMRRRIALVIGSVDQSELAGLERQRTVDVPRRLWWVRNEPVGGRSRFWIHGRVGSLRPWSGCLRPRESQGGRDQRGDHGQMEQGSSSTSARSPRGEAASGYQAGGRARAES